MSGICAILSYQLPGIIDVEEDDSDEERKEEDPYSPEKKLKIEEDLGSEETDSVNIQELDEFMQDVDEDDDLDFM